MDENRYTFSIERPEDTPPPPPPKKRNRAAIVALLLVGALLFSALGGAAGFYISDYLGSDAGGDSPQMQNGDNPSPSSNPSSNPVDQLAAVKNPSGQQLTIPQVYEKCDAAVVAISTETTSNVFGQQVSQASAGSGFLISSDGYVVTNYHVISGATNITVMLNDGKEYPAELVGGDKTTDLAVLKINGSGFSYLELGNSGSIVVGDQVVAIGNPLGELANSLSVGYISALERTINIDGDPMVMLQTDASVSPGNSGGPLINMYGQVIGIVSAKSTGSGVEGIGFAIPMNTAADVINDLIDHGYVTGRAYFGISVQEFTGNTAAYYNISSGLYIMSVDSGSCADKAGLQVGDKIVSLGGTAINSSSDLKAKKLTYKAGDTATIVVLRDGSELSIPITFDEEKSSTDADSGADLNDGNSTDPFNQYPWGSGGSYPWSQGSGN